MLSICYEILEGRIYKRIHGVIDFNIFPKQSINQSISEIFKKVLVPRKVAAVLNGAKTNTGTRAPRYRGIKAFIHQWGLVQTTTVHKQLYG